jgi:hypothetical protein
MTRHTGKNPTGLIVSVLNYIYFRPFSIVSRPDGHPAVEVDNGGKKQQFVSTTRRVISIL